MIFGVHLEAVFKQVAERTQVVLTSSRNGPSRKHLTSVNRKGVWSHDSANFSNFTLVAHCEDWFGPVRPRDDLPAQPTPSPTNT